MGVHMVGDDLQGELALLERVVESVIAIEQLAAIGMVLGQDRIVGLLVADRHLEIGQGRLAILGARVGATLPHFGPPAIQG